jgi:hypothetical protein
MLGSCAASKFNRIPQLEINLESEASRLRSDFNTFLSTIVANLTERHDQGSILKNSILADYFSDNFLPQILDKYQPKNNPHININLLENYIKEYRI